MSTGAFKVPVHVEIAVRASCSLRTDGIVATIADWIRRKCGIFQNGNIQIDGEIAHITDSIVVTDLAPGKCVSFWQAELCLHPYRLSTQGPENDFMEGEEELPAAEQWELPNALLNNLWSSIVIDSVVKTRLLSYCSSSIRFSEAKIDTDIISWNRMILLHGPPGTGKTTICKGLAQKTFIRNSDRFSSGILLEVNSHSLFSKWFSESGKLVMKLFAHIAEIAEDEECMVVVLIDEVESITASRGSAARSNEPGDAVRVVNAVLTSLDALKRRPNVLVLCTSNLVDSVDPAFLDRVDLKVFLGPPPVQARYNILHSCLTELMGKGIITPSEELGQECTAVEVQLLTLAQAHLPLPLATSTSTANSKIKPTSTQARKTAARLQEQHRAARAAALQALVHSVVVPDFDAVELMDIALDLQDQDQDQDQDQEPVMEIESSSGASEMGSSAGSQSEGYTQGTSSSEGLSPAVGKVHIGRAAVTESVNSPHSSAESAEEGEIFEGEVHGGGEGEEGESEEEQGGTAFELGLTPEQYLYVVAALCQDMSGRSLRKLPIKAHSYYLQRPVVSVMEFLCAMHATIQAEKESAAKSKPSK